MSSLPEQESYLSDSMICILRVIVGVILGLLTVYRREMSCNREYHPDDNGAVVGEGRSSNRSWGDHIRRDRNTGLRRRVSSSSLPTLCNTPSQEATRNVKNSDPTEELLESAGFLFSGGPFLAVMLAVLDHLILTVFLTSVASVGTLMMSWRRNDQVAREGEDKEEEGVTNQEELDTQTNPSIHHVAWNAAADYFTSISSKLDETGDKPSLAQSPVNKPMRSKSADNISQLSNEQYLELIAIARGYLDISALPSETQVSIFSYLHPTDLLSYTCTHRKGNRMLNDAVDINTVNVELHSRAEKDTAMLIWKELFKRDYAWVLKEWKVGQEALQRSINVLNTDDVGGQTVTADNKIVLHHILSSTTTGGMYNLDEISSIRHPLTSMKEFYFTFAETWLNYAIAGCNTTKKCLIGLHGHVFDISSFVGQHPGSTETLLLQAGRDATVFFETMGHSLRARKTALSMCEVVNGQCISWGSLDEESLDRVLDKKSSYVPNWGLIRPNCPALKSRILTPGFVIPRKRSKPRASGGLSRIRERMNREAELELIKACRWSHSTLGVGGLFGGVQVYYDPICCRWRWWYTGLNFDPVYTDSVE